MWGEVLLVSFLIPLQWKDTSVYKRVMTLLIVSSLSVTSHDLFDYSYLAVGHAIGFRVVQSGPLLFYSQRETIISKFLRRHCFLGNSESFRVHRVFYISTPARSFTKLLASWFAKGYNSMYLVKRSTIGRKYQYPPSAQRSVPMSILTAGVLLLIFIT